MPLQNRVTPLGELVAVPERGLLYGNRGVLHDGRGRIRRRFQGERWIACRLEFRGRRRHPLLQPGRYTELFFVDEATALAAGHRPCAECRRADYERFRSLWRELHPDDERAPEIDARLHRERLAGPWRGRAEGLPDGAFVLGGGEPWLVRGGSLRLWTPGGYTERAPRPRGEVDVVTAPSLVAVLAAGFEPLLHPSA